MQRESNEFLRANSLLQADKSLMSESCKALALQDFAEKFSEYFDLNGLPRMELSRENGVYTIQIRFEAERIKKFNVLK